MADAVSHLRLSTFVHYGIAVGLPAAAEALRTLLSWQWGMPHWLIMYLPVVMTSAWCGGLGPGLVSSVTSVLVVMYFELPPKHSFRVEDAAELIGVVVLAGIGSVVSFLARRDGA